MQRIHVTIRPLNREDSVLYFPPEAFGPFRVLHQIGAGTLGPVFRAYEPAGQRRDRLVAVKVFRLDLTPEQSAALVGELDALVGAHINHPNIAAPIAAGLEHGAAYLAQEYAVGDSLDVVLRERGPMAMRDVVALVASLASAIDHAADRGVHHGLLHLRDIVLGADTVRITGFGIAAALDKVGAQLPTRPTYALNAEIAAAGMPADVYSLMAMAFEAATGKRLSPDNLNDLEAEHGADVRAAFKMQPLRAGEFAEALARGAGVLGALGAPGALGAAPTPRAPVAPSAPSAPIALDSDFDLRLDAAVDLMGDADDDPADRLVIEPASVPPPPFPTAWSEQSPRVQHVSEPEPEQASRRWPIVVMFLVFAVLTALSVSFFLTPSPVAERDAAVDETVVDLPNAAPAPNASTSAPAEPAELRRDRPNAPGARTAPNAPSPSPSRPASGAVRRTQTGSMLIRSTPADADVVVNGKPRGKTPLALRDLELGSYNIRVARDGYAADERTLQLTARRPTTSTTITLRPTSAPSSATVGKPTRAVGDASATLNVQSRPAGARVFVNDRLAGATPIAIPGLPAGDATVRIEKDGYIPWTATVRVNAGEQTAVRASLEGK